MVSFHHWKQEEVLRIMASLEPNASLTKVKQAFDPVFSSLRRARKTNEPYRQQQRQHPITPILIICDKGQVNLLDYALTTYHGEGCDGSTDRQAFRECWGDPCLALDTQASQNSAINHAASNGNPELVPYLVDLMRVYDANEKHDALDGGAFRLVSCLNAHGDTPIMMAARAGHLAWVEACLEHVNASITQSAQDLSHIPNEQQRMKRLHKWLQHSNSSGDTLLSLAYGHGHAHLVQYLLDKSRQQRFGLYVTADDLHKCQDLLGRAAVYVASLSTTAESKRAKRKFDGMKHAYAIIQECAEQYANEQMNLLLRELDQEEGRENSDATGSPPKRTKPKRKKQNKKQRSKSLQEESAGPSKSRTSDIASASTYNDTDFNANLNEIHDNAKSTTPQQSPTNTQTSSQRLNSTSFSDDQDSKPDIDTPNVSMPQEMLQGAATLQGDETSNEIYLERTESDFMGSMSIQPVNSNGPNGGQPQDSSYEPHNAIKAFENAENVDNNELQSSGRNYVQATTNIPADTEPTMPHIPSVAVVPSNDASRPIVIDQVQPQLDYNLMLDALDALCLGVHDLLKTPKSMEEDLSPAQLDAIENVLQKQLLAVQNARAIQKQRRLSIDEDE